MGVPWWFPMDPMWWMLLMKGVNLKSPAGYSRSIHEAASSPIQCSLYTDRGRPREKWRDGIGFEALRQVIKSNTPTHQGMWFPQVPLALLHLPITLCTLCLPVLPLRKQNKIKLCAQWRAPDLVARARFLCVPRLWSHCKLNMPF